MFDVHCRWTRAFGLVVLSAGCSTQPDTDAQASAVVDGGEAATTESDAGRSAVPSERNPDEEPSSEPEPSLDGEPSSEPEPSPSAEPSFEPEPSPSAEPSAEPEPSSTAEPSIEPSPEGAGSDDDEPSFDDAGSMPVDATAPSDGVPNDARLTVFYLDVGGSVMATDVEEPRARTIVEDAGQGPDGIAIDLDAGHIYWTGMGVPSEDDGFIRRSDLDGDNIVTIIPEGDTYTPKQLKIDLESGKLYWSDREGMRVMRANLDGSELETLVTTGEGESDRDDTSRWCVGIALDLDAGYFYWSQKGSDASGVGTLRRARLEMPEGEDSTDRSDIEVLFDGLPEPIDVDVDVANQLIYWTDRGDDTINRAPIEIPEGATAANRDDREILIEGVREAIGVTLDLERGKLYFTGGTAGRVGMANLDGSAQVDLLNGTAGLTGIVVVPLPE